MAAAFAPARRHLAPLGASVDVWAGARKAWWYYYASQPEGVDAIA